MQGKCIDPNGSANLKVEGIYYLFPHGGSAYEVSNFPRLGSHFGIYQKSRFEIMSTNELSTEPKKPNKFPLHWFTNIREYNSEEIKEEIKELPREQWQQVDLFNL